MVYVVLITALNIDTVDPERLKKKSLESVIRSMEQGETKLWNRSRESWSRGKYSEDGTL